MGGMAVSHVIHYPNSVESLKASDVSFLDPAQVISSSVQPTEVLGANFYVQCSVGS